MGNKQPGMGAPQTPETSKREAQALFKLIDQDGDHTLSRTEWELAFSKLDRDGNGVITRKEYARRQGGTYIFDAIAKTREDEVTVEDWKLAFNGMDTDGSGQISLEECLAQRIMLRLGLKSLGIGMSHWGVAVGSEFYEVLPASRASTEMAVLGPKGVVSFGEFARTPGQKEAWLEQIRQDVTAGNRPQEAWLEDLQEPRACQEELWDSFEAVGGTTRTEGEILEWIIRWVEEHPRYRAIDPFGNECNDHTFAIDFISWLRGSPYRKVTDNQKGRALFYGGLAVLAGAGVVYFNRKGKEPDPEALARTEAKNSRKEKKAAMKEESERVALRA